MKINSLFREDGGEDEWEGVRVAATDKTCATKTRQASGRTLATSFTLRKEESCYS